MEESSYDESLLEGFNVKLPDGLKIRPLRKNDHENGKKSFEALKNRLY